MKPQDPKARSRAALREAVDRYGRERARSAARGPEPWPGDLYALAETAGFPVEWLVVERLASGRCQVVAADTNPALGSSDVPVPAEHEGGPLSVRCAISLRVDVDTLRRGERNGAVAPASLDRVRQRLENLAAGSPAPLLNEDDEPDPELEDWFNEVLEPARATLLPSGLEASKPPRRFGRLAAGVAFLLLLVALGGSLTLAWSLQQRERLALREVEHLVHERRNLEAEHQRQLAALLETQAQPLLPLEPPPLEPPPPVREPLRPLVNLAYSSFYPGETRGDLKEIAIPSHASHLFLVFYAGHQDPCDDYRLEITRRGAPAAFLTVKELRPLPGQEVSVAVPRAQLPDGSYQFRLYGMCDGERRELGAYEARLKEDAQ